MTKTPAVIVLAAVAGTVAASAGSSSAHMAVSVTVVRSCSVDTGADDFVPAVRLTCTNGAQSTLKVSEAAQPASTTVVNEGSKTITLNF
jgi:UDP-N-acetylmuramyl tripeptide synthase